MKFLSIFWGGLAILIISQSADVNAAKNEGICSACEAPDRK